MTLELISDWGFSLGRRVPAYRVTDHRFKSSTGFDIFGKCLEWEDHHRGGLKITPPQKKKKKEKKKKETLAPYHKKR